MDGQENIVAGRHFDQDFRDQFRDLLRWRRDVRQFKPDPIPEELLEEILSSTRFAPSVGLSESWRYVLINQPESRKQIREDFELANTRALAGYSGEKANLYARLKLAGLDSAPVHLAAFADRGTLQGHGLGCQTMPEMLDYSVVAAITTLWLMARAHGVGLGWVSILNPERVKTILSVPAEWHFVAYLCIGYPTTEATMPELERAGWERRRQDVTVLER
jgi:5,6-dimethylbenzimidazole synthase